MIVVSQAYVQYSTGVKHIQPGKQLYLSCEIILYISTVQLLLLMA